MIKVFLNEDLLAKHLALEILKQLKRKKKINPRMPWWTFIEKNIFLYWEIIS